MKTEQFKPTACANIEWPKNCPIYKKGSVCVKHCVFIQPELKELGIQLFADEDMYLHWVQKVSE